jgi:uncharacterized protein YqhQ
MARFAYGGQALIEGVMMRAKDGIAVAVRAPDGRIGVETAPLAGRAHASRAARLPFLRGLVVLYEQFTVGVVWLYRTASIGIVEKTGMEIGPRTIALSMAFALAFTLGLFLVLPLLLASSVAKPDAGVGQHLLEGAIRIGVFLAYLLLVGQTRQLGRVFRYHGAEHMTIHALEAGEALTIENVRRHPTAHPRCGTEFLIIVFVMAILAFSIVGKGDPLFMVGSRLILVPVLAGVSYELLRYLARHRDNVIMRALAAPGIWVQMITTKQPDDAMIEVAIASLREALVADGEPVPAGSLELPTTPIPVIIAEAKDTYTANKAKEAAEKAAA